MKLFALTLLLLAPLSFGQSKASGTSNKDLRTKKIKFNLEKLSGLEGIELLENSQNFILQKLAKNKVTGSVRLSNHKADEIDKEFVGKFIEIKYSLPKYSGKKCSPAYKMSMRGETFTICSGEPKKIAAVESVFKSLNERF